MAESTPGSQGDLVAPPDDDLVGTDSATAAERARYHLTEMEAWLGGRRSVTNLISPDAPSAGVDCLVQIADAQRAAGHAAAAQAWAAVLGLSI